MDAAARHLITNVKMTAGLLHHDGGGAATSASGEARGPPPPAASLTSDPRTRCRASSVLDRNKQLYGEAHMLSADDSSCWNSAQGTPQQVQVLFHRTVSPSSLRIMFQGGFTGQDVQVHVRRPQSSRWEAADALVDVEPEDSNALQEFSCRVGLVTALALTFQRSSDFYGRVVIYRLDVLGAEIPV